MDHPLQTRALCATCDGLLPLLDCPQCYADARDRERSHVCNGEDQCEVAGSFAPLQLLDIEAA